MLFQVIPLGDEDNFWSMGDGPGPCGPCTEIFYDQRTPDVDGETWLEVHMMGSFCSSVPPCILLQFQYYIPHRSPCGSAMPPVSVCL